MTEWLKQIQNEVIDFFFPQVCIGCGKVGGFICFDCSKKLSRLLPPLCKKCGRPESSGAYCNECWRNSNSLDTIRSVFIFEGVTRMAIHEFKYHNLRALSHCLSGFMAQYFRENQLVGDILLPVPLHDRRLKERGYNQSELLAREISKVIALPVKVNLVKRVKDNKPQARTVSVKERRINMLNAFVCTSSEVYGKDIVIIDDVCTSGATLESCAGALKAGGARNIVGFTLAREIFHGS